MSKLTRRWILGGLGALIGGSLLAAGPVLGVRRLHPLTRSKPSGGAYDWGAWQAILDSLVRDGAVLWEQASSGPGLAAIEALYAELAEVGPTATPERFPDDDSRLAYAINTYNLLVIVAVVRHFPIRTVGDVRGLVEPAPLVGFFHGLRLRVDGGWVSLSAHEKAMFARWPDSRLHAAINCASASCPPLPATAFVGSTLDAQLDQACIDWLRTPGSVTLDEGSREVVLPPLLGLYPGDFGDAARDHGWGETDTDWVLHWLTDDRAAQVRGRLDQGWTVRVPPYDWALTGQPRS